MLARRYRQAPLKSIWEGSGNIQCLDVLRALAREPESGAALLAELEVAAGMDAGYDAWLSGLKTDLASGQIEEARSEEHTSELQSLMRISYAVFCLKKKKYTNINAHHKDTNNEQTQQ